MTKFEQAQETLRKARSRVEPGEFIKAPYLGQLDGRTGKLPPTRRLDEGQTDAKGFLKNADGYGRDDVVPGRASKDHFAGFPQRGGSNGRPAGKADDRPGDHLHKVTPPNPKPTRTRYQNEFENPFGENADTHSRVAAHAPSPTRRDASAEPEAGYEPRTTDECAVACNCVMSAMSDAMCADSCAEREGNLSKALEMLDVGCRAHRDLKRGK